jgi:hypothetical protein
VYALLRVEGDPDQPLAVPWKWRKGRNGSLEPSALDMSFPHRSRAERDGIVGGFIGAATRQRVCLHFGRDFGALPTTTAALGPWEST